VITRASAIELPAWAGKPVTREVGGWPVLECFDPPEGRCAVGLTDLSHRPKAVVHGQAVAALGLSRPGQATWNGRSLSGCLKPREAAVFDLTGSVEPRRTDGSHTDMTEGWVLLGLWGQRSLDVVQRLVTVDVEPRTIEGPLFFATSSHGLRIQLVNLRRSIPGFVLACSRSHGQNIFEACLRAGRQFDLKITGTKAFEEWLGSA
jgi:glycine cleavage system aminomethyltransferase T